MRRPPRLTVGSPKRLSMIYSPMNRIPKNPIKESVWLVCSATPWLRVLPFRAHFPEFPMDQTNVARHSWRSEVGGMLRPPD